MVLWEICRVHIKMHIISTNLWKNGKNHLHVTSLFDSVTGGKQVIYEHACESYLSHQRVVVLDGGDIYCTMSIFTNTKDYQNVLRTNARNQTL